MNIRTKTDAIVVHCAATDPEWHGRVTRDDIDKWHKERGWAGIGYHFYIDRDGVLHIGRELQYVGAHVAGHNSHTAGICLEGGIVAVHHTDGRVSFDPSPNYTDAQWETLRALIEVLLYLYEGAEVKGHRDFPGVTKQCPSFDVGLWWETGEISP